MIPSGYLSCSVTFNGANDAERQRVSVNAGDIKKYLRRTPQLLRLAIYHGIREKKEIYTWVFKYNKSGRYYATGGPPWPDKLPQRDATHFCMRILEEVT